MATYNNRYAFNIVDVALLLGLTVRREVGNGAYADCPFCGDRRGKLFFSTSIDAFNCNYCGEHGGIVTLYTRLTGAGKDGAYQEIKERLQIQAQSESYTYPAAQRKMKQVQNSELADPRSVHDTMTEMLKILKLSAYHRQKLRMRGLSDAQIDTLDYKSVPSPSSLRGIMDRLMSMGLLVQGVPGFYLLDNGKWTINLSYWAHGIFVPYRGYDGLIGGMQIRLDVPIKDKNDPAEKEGTKYVWFSSASKHMGVSSGSPLHFVGDRNAKTVYVTEGAMKADVSHFLSGRTFAATAGANNVGKLASLFQTLAANGTTLIIEAEDMDKLTNDAVARGAAKVRKMAEQSGLDCRSLSWDSYKGIDDWLLARMKKREMIPVAA